MPTARERSGSRRDTANKENWAPVNAMEGACGSVAPAAEGGAKCSLSTLPMDHAITETRTRVGLPCAVAKPACGSSNALPIGLLLLVNLFFFCGSRRLAAAVGYVPQPLWQRGMGYAHCRRPVAHTCWFWPGASFP